MEEKKETVNNNEMEENTGKSPEKENTSESEEKNSSLNQPDASASAAEEKKEEEKADQNTADSSTEKKTAEETEKAAEKQNADSAQGHAEKIRSVPLPSAPVKEKKHNGKKVLAVIGIIAISCASGFGGGYIAGRQAAKDEIGEMEEKLLNPFESFGFQMPGNGGSSDQQPSSSQQENTNKAALGIYVKDSSDGPVVAGFTADSKAETAGIKSGDIITKLDDTEVSSVSDMRTFLADKDAGDTVTVTVRRDDKDQEIKVELVANDSSSSQSSAPSEDDHSDFPSDSDSSMQG